MPPTATPPTTTPGMAILTTRTITTRADTTTATIMTTTTAVDTLTRMPAGTAIATAEAEAVAPAATMLFCWLSPAFPVGGYAYSHGLEWAAEAADVRDAATLSAWLATVLCEGAGRSDAILLGAAHRAVSAGDDAELVAVNDLALALAPSAELRLETAQQGRSFLSTVRATWPADRLEQAGVGLDEVAYPVAVGLAAAAHGIGLTETARIYVTAFAANLVSAAIRLAPIGQTAGQRVLAGLAPLLAATADRAIGLDLDDVGGPTFRADLGSFRHETQYTRLFRS